MINEMFIPFPTIPIIDIPLIEVGSIHQYTYDTNLDYDMGD